MKRLATALLALSITACTSAGPPPEPVIERGGKPYQFTADPGALVAVDIAMQQSVRADGFAKMAKDYAAKDAQILSDRRYPLAEFNKATPPYTTSSPLSAFMSCDGRTGAVLTASTDADGFGWQTLTVWAKTRDGAWRWVMQKSVYGAKPAAPAPDMIATKTAKCGTKAGVSLSAPAVGIDKQVGLSADQSLAFTSTDYKNGTTELSVALWDGQAMVTQAVLLSDGQ